MARDEVDMTPVETRDDLVAWLEAGNKPKSRFRIGTEPVVATRILRAEPGASGLATTLSSYEVGNTRYFSAAGFPGRTVGLTEQRADGR